MRVVNTGKLFIHAWLCTSCVAGIYCTFPKEPKLLYGEKGASSILYKKEWGALNFPKIIELDPAASAKFTNLAKQAEEAYPINKQASELILKQELASYVDSTEKAQTR